MLWIVLLGSVFVSIFALILRCIALLRADADLTLVSLPDPPENAYAHRVVWITGASQGLGAAIARAFANTGCKLVLSARSTTALEAVQAACAATMPPDHISLLPFDLLTTSDSDIQAAVRTAEGFFGAIDVVVHNAGMSQHSLAMHMPTSAFHTMLKLNLVAPLTLTHAVLPGMLARQWGQFIVISSMSALVPSAGQAQYASSKAALASYFQSLGSELADRNITVTVAYPGPIARESETPRLVMGAKGTLVPAAPTGDKGRQPTSRVAQLVVRGAYHHLHRCWIAQFPVLPMAYLSQYMPVIALNLMKQVGPRRARAMDAGEGGYDVNKLTAKMDWLAVLGWRRGGAQASDVHRKRQ